MNPVLDEPAIKSTGSRRPGALSGIAVVALVALIVTVTVFGLVVPDAYRQVSELQRQVWRAQDAVNLAILPVLMWAWVKARAGSVGGQIVLTGILAWLAYCYAHLAFAAPFTPIFLAYVGVLSLASSGTLQGLRRMDADVAEATFAGAARVVAGWFLIVSALGITGLWLSDIVPGVFGGTPAELHLAGLPNPTWVLDLAFLIPAAFTAGVMLVRHRSGGVFLGGILLVLLALLSVAMLASLPFGLAAGLARDPVAGPQMVAFTVIFAVLGCIEAWLLINAARHQHVRK